MTTSISLEDYNKLMYKIETALNDAASDVKYGDEKDGAEFIAEGIEEALNIVRYLISVEKREAFERETSNHSDTTTIKPNTEEVAAIRAAIWGGNCD